MDVVTHTKHDFIPGTPHPHTLLSRIRDSAPALRTAAIRGSSGARRASAPCSFLCCSKLSQLLSWAKLSSPSTKRLGCKPNLRLCCPSAACCTHASPQPLGPFVQEPEQAPSWLVSRLGGPNDSSLLNVLMPDGFPIAPQMDLPDPNRWPDRY